MTYELRVVVDGVELSAFVLKSKPAKVTLTLSTRVVSDVVTVLGTKEIVIP